MYYYEVLVGAHKSWSRGIYTYAADEVLAPSTIVRVPYGQRKIVGLITKRSRKPVFETKLIETVIGPAPKHVITLLDWLQTYYALSRPEAASLLFPAYIGPLKHPGEHTEVPIEQPPSLTVSQKKAVKTLLGQKSSVLYGVTGSGKTRVYLELIKTQLEQGLSCVLLHPEITLNTQLFANLSKHIDAPVYRIHSGMTNAQRSAVWYAVYFGTTPCVVIGPRSALFLPFHALGAVIIDEAHDGSYQQESSVRYNALHVAAKLASDHKALCVYGSATPPTTETYYALQRSADALVRLEERAIKDTHNKSVHVVSMKKRALFKKHPLLSDTLLEATKTVLDEGRQALLFLNRRGTAKYVLCADETCEWHALCTHCELPLTYHHDDNALQCHTCGRTTAMPTVCPISEHSVSLKNFGSKSIEADVRALFPNNSVYRFDSDTVKKERFSEQYDSLRDQPGALFIGTQQIVKGLDLPKLGVVGIINADLSLHFPDFSSEERMFQLLNQAIGRVGRGHGSSTIVVQTFQPDNPVLQQALNDQWELFYKTELKKRSEHHFPPFSYYAKIYVRDASLTTTVKNAEQLRDRLTDAGIVTEGPLPAFHTKVNNKYQILLLMRSSSRKKLLAATQSAKKSMQSVYIELDPHTLL